MKTFIYSLLLIFVTTCSLSCSTSLSRDAQVKFEQGEEALKDKQYDQAIEYFTQYLNTSPDDADAHLKLGLAFLHQQQLREAIYNFKETLRLDPENQESKSLIKHSILDESRRFGREGQQETSMRYLTAYLTIDPDDFDSYLALAEAFIERGDRGNAIKCLNKLVSLEPRHPEVIALLDLFSDGFH